MGFLRSWVGMLVGVGHRNVLIVRPLKSPLSMFCLSVHHMIPRHKSFRLLKASPFPWCFWCFSSYSSVFDKDLFCLREREGLFINNECSSWYSRIREFSMSVWDRRREILYGSGLAQVVGWANPTLECEANGVYCYHSCKWVYYHVFQWPINWSLMFWHEHRVWASLFVRVSMVISPHACSFMLMDKVVTLELLPHFGLTWWILKGLGNCYDVWTYLPFFSNLFLFFCSWWLNFIK